MAMTFMLHHVIGIIWKDWQKNPQPTNQQKKKNPQTKPYNMFIKSKQIWRYGSLTAVIQVLRGCGMHQWHYYEDRSTQHMAGVDL